MIRSVLATVASRAAFAVCLSGALVFVPATVLAASPVPGSIDYCLSVATPSSWSTTERWVWRNLCLDDAADFTDRGAPRDRLVSDRFLNAIVEIEPFRSALHGTIFIIGAHFAEAVNLEYVAIRYPLWLQDSTFDHDVDLSGVQVPHLNFQGSVFRGDLNLAGAQVDGSIEIDSDDNQARVDGEFDMHDIVVGRHGSISGRYGTIDLSNARFGSYLDLEDTHANEVTASNAEIGGYFLTNSAAIRRVDLRGATVKGNAFFRDGAALGTLQLVDAQIAGQVDISGSTVQSVEGYGVRIGGQLFVQSQCRVGALNLSSAKLDQDVRLQAVRLKSLSLSGASIGGNLSISNLRLYGPCACDHVHVQRNVVIERSTFDKKLGLQYLNSNGNIVLGGSGAKTPAFGLVDLTASHADGDFILRRERSIWREDGGLILRNASVHAFEDRSTACSDVSSTCPDPWPRNLELNGFIYQQLGTLTQSIRRDTSSGAVEFRDMAERGVPRWRDWLAREKLSPQPYEQLASVLRQLGHPEDATKLLYQEKNDELGHAHNWRWFVLWLDRAVVGFGYYPYVASYWLAGLLAVGCLVLVLSGEYQRITKARHAHEPEPFPLGGLVYSFDTLIPLVSLRKSDDDLELRGWARNYFYFHRIAGWVLASFVVAGLAGLTK